MTKRTCSICFKRLPFGAFRILASGHWIITRQRVAPEDTFGRRLPQALCARYLDRTIEVVNGGAGDYGTEQELIWLRKR